MKNLKNFLRSSVFILPLIIGMIGYRITGCDFWDSMYGAFTLYAVNPLNSEKNALIEVARWTAPAALASGVLICMKRVITAIKNWFKAFHADAVAVYGKSQYSDIFCKKFKRSILAEDNPVKSVNFHILMFENDRENLEFYENNRDFFCGKQVYIKSETEDSFQLNIEGVHFFNVNEIIARSYWIDRNMAEHFTKTNSFNVAIIGFGYLGQRILNSAILNNIYRLDQSIEYNIWGDSLLYSKVHEDILQNMMNADKIIYHSGSWENDIEKIAFMDRVIITDSDNTDMIKAIWEINPKCEIDCFNPLNSIMNIYQSKNFFSFGEYEKVLTEENIKTDNIYYWAKELNYQYESLSGAKEGKSDGENLNGCDRENDVVKKWNALNAFTKGSNIASVEYHSIRSAITALTKVDGMVLAEMEHLRWCRYHYLNHWKKGAGADGNKDSANRLHPCLIPFDKLNEGYVQKDLNTINCLYKLQEQMENQK